MFSVDNRSRGKALGIAVFLSLAAFLQSCSSDLLSAPPATVGVSLTAAPTVTTTFDSASLSFSTDESVTVSVDYGKAPGAYTGSVPRSASGATDHDVAISGLDTATKYYFRVVSYLGSARTFNSMEYYFTTDTDPGVLAITAGPTVTPALASLAISWTSNYACTHIVEYGTSAGSYTESTVATTVAGTNHTETLSGLAPGITYNYRIRLLWNAGDDFTSLESNATTTAEATPTAAQKARGIWLLGGLSGPTINLVVGEVDMYDPVTNAWYTAVTSVPTPVSFAGYAAANGKLFVFGGFDSGGAALPLVQIYTISSGLWSTGAAIPLARANIKATVSNGKIYIMGGTALAAGAAWAGNTTNYEYDMASDSWNTRAVFGAAGSGRFSFAFSDVIYNLGGRTSTTAVAATHDAYAYANNSNTTPLETVLTLARTGLMGDTYQPSPGSGIVILAGGVTTLTGTPRCFINQDAASGPLSNLIQYLVVYPFTVGNLWTIPASGLTTLPAPMGFGAAAVSTKVTPARFYIFGGTTSTPPAASGTTTVYWWNVPVPGTPWTWNGTWTSAAPMPVARPRWGHGAVTLNN